MYLEGTEKTFFVLKRYAQNFFYRKKNLDTISEKKVQNAPVEYLKGMVDTYNNSKMVTKRCQQDSRKVRKEPKKVLQKVRKKCEKGATKVQQKVRNWYEKGFKNALPF